MLDVREMAAHGDGHPLFAAPCPYSRLEPAAAALLPRRSVPVILVDDGDGLSEKAARRLAALEFSDVRVLDGGTAAWVAAGYRLFSGVNVPSKTLGELVEHALQPRTIKAHELKAWMDEGRAFRLFDVRPPSEYSRMTLPGAENAPNGELAHRFGALVADETTPVVLTCAGRTRGLIGATGLQLAGIGNPIYALEDGTQGWTLAGFDLLRGQNARRLPAADRKASHARFLALAAADGISRVSAADVEAMVTDPSRTTHVFDLRTKEERAADPLPGAKGVSGVQLVQATDHYVAVRRARLVLVDDTGLRAGLAAVFLSRMGFDVHVLSLDSELGARPSLSESGAWSRPSLPPISADAAVDLISEGSATLIDLRPSSDHARWRPEGSIWSMRPRLANDLPADIKKALLFSDEPDHAAIASLDLAEMGVTPSFVDANGWRASSNRIDETVLPLTRDRAPDMVWFTHGRHDGDREASLRYLAWEKNLIAELDPQERAEFRI